MFQVLILVALVNLLVGFFLGYITRFKEESDIVNESEKQIYCHGYEDGFYLGWGTYDPENFRPEIAEKAYAEYKGIKHGPVKH